MMLAWWYACWNDGEEKRVKTGLNISFFCGREESGKRWKMEAEGRDKESEEEVYDFGVGAGA